MFSKHVAIANQYMCNTILLADQEFEKSCEICCNDPKCMWKSNCDRCPVAEAHRAVINKLKAGIRA